MPSNPRFFVIQGGPSPHVILDVVARRHGPPRRAVMGNGPAPRFVYSVVEFKPRGTRAVRVPPGPTGEAVKRHRGAGCTPKVCMLADEETMTEAEFYRLIYECEAVDALATPIPPPRDIGNPWTAVSHAPGEGTQKACASWCGTEQLGPVEGNGHREYQRGGRAFCTKACAEARRPRSSQ